MALTEQTFRDRYPEFKAISSALVVGALADAAKRLSPAVLGDRYDEAQGCRAAHLLAGGRPWGAAARLKDGNGKTVYSEAFDQIVIEVAAGFGVT